MKKQIFFAATTPFAVNAFLANHLRALAKQYQVSLCVNTEAYEISPKLRESIEVIHVDFVRKISPVGDLRSLWQLLRLFLKRSPMAVHSITPKAGLLAMLAGFLTRVPCRYHTFTGQVWANKQGLARRILKVFDRLIIGFASQVFADSASQCRFLVDEGVAKPGGISVLGQGSIAGVDLNRFQPSTTVRQQTRAQFGTAEDVCVFLFVGRLAKDKGVFDLVKAFCTLKAMNPNVALWVVGPNEEGLLEQLQQQSAGGIQWIGATPQPERYMASADVLVLPSYREGFGSVIIEAAACAIPTIAYRIDGVIDAVVEGSTGLLVEMGNVDAFASTMLLFSKDALHVKELGAQALSRVRKDFSSVTVTAQWLSFYQDVI